eukprot:3514974-Prymnesium_polylepis.1
MSYVCYTSRSPPGCSQRAARTWVWASAERRSSRRQTANDMSDEPPSAAAEEGSQPPKRISLPKPVLSEIHEGKALRSTAAADGVWDGSAAAETFARGALLNELRKGKELKKQSERPAAPPANQTMARAGLLNELQRKRTPTAPSAEGAGQGVIDEKHR